MSAVERAQGARAELGRAAHDRTHAGGSLSRAREAPTASLCPSAGKTARALAGDAAAGTTWRPRIASSVRPSVAPSFSPGALASPLSPPPPSPPLDHNWRPDLSSLTPLPGPALAAPSPHNEAPLRSPQASPSPPPHARLRPAGSGSAAPGGSASSCPWRRRRRRVVRGRRSAGRARVAGPVSAAPAGAAAGGRRGRAGSGSAGRLWGRRDCSSTGE